MIPLKRNLKFVRCMPYFRHSPTQNLVLSSQLADFASPTYGGTSLEALFAFLTLGQCYLRAQLPQSPCVILLASVYKMAVCHNARALRRQRRHN